MVDDFSYGVEYLFEPIRERAVGALYRAARNVGGLVTLEVEHTESRKAGTGIDPKYACRFAQTIASDLCEHVIGYVGIAKDLLNVIEILKDFQQLDHCPGFFDAEFGMR